MTQIKSNIPKIRFKEFSQEWEEKKLWEVSERITSKNKENNNNPLTISAQLWLVNQEIYFNKVVASKNLSWYYLLNKWDFAYNKSYSKWYPLGAIKRLKLYNKWVVSTLYICFRFKQNNSNDFFEQLFNSQRQNYEISKIAQEWARNHWLLNIWVLDFFHIKLFFPKLQEQQKIADFLSLVDEKIENIKDKKKSLEEYKKGVMQKIFKQEIRFKDENGENFGDWEEKKLGEIASFEQWIQVDLDLQIKEKKENYIRFLRIENYTQKSNDFRFIPVWLSNNKYIKDYEVVIVRYWATAWFIWKWFEWVLANNLFKIKPNKNLTNKFLFIILKRKETFNFFQSAMAWWAMPALSFWIVKQLKISFPSLPEQEKIAIFLSGIDDKIESIESELEIVKKFKKGLLQGVFV